MGYGHILMTSHLLLIWDDKFVLCCALWYMKFFFDFPITIMGNILQ